ncbi:hypothetical protein KY290_005399 [Solanum tuberosum]|uniref:PTM/DIR17-like Tudor domain-containing protein n=1 Tax=Solanum tuberosum TaxID=4113 RepID=A0ABQ7WE16_SOLTU|nr:hypothetical protein KY289_005795 [Solanum tuberosum]KAH0778972.1 hypothetical protein KY290_005399 [Solanum tuberosum]
MDFPFNDDKEESLVPGVFEIPGKPVVAINGLPPVSSSVDTFSPLPTVTDAAEESLNTVIGPWFEGREVRKLFGNQYYYREITEFDGKVGRFKVKYENGNVEELEWNELDQVLHPLNLNIPLATISIEYIRRKQRSIQKLGKSEGGTTNEGVKNE